MLSTFPRRQHTGNTHMQGYSGYTKNRRLGIPALAHRVIADYVMLCSNAAYDVWRYGVAR